MNRQLIALLFAGAAIGSGAQAQDLSGAVTLGFGHLSADGSDADTIGLQGYYDARFENGLSVAADFGIQRAKFDGSTGVTSTDIRLKPRFRFGNGVLVGAYYEHLNIAADGDNLGVTHYGATVGYAVNGLSLEAFVGRTDGGDIGGDTIGEAGLSAVYVSGNGLAIGAGYVRGSEAGFDLDAFRIGATHDLTDSWTLFGGAEMADVDGVDVTTLGLGTSHRLPSLFGRPASVSLELERISVDTGGASNSANGVRLGLTIPLGGATTKVPLNSVAHQALRPRHTALPGIVTQGSLF